MLITVLPMLGDYFTNQLLSGTTGTTMFGNVIDEQLTSSGGVLEGQGAVFSLLFLLVLIAAMIYYVVATPGSSQGRRDDGRYETSGGGRWDDQHHSPSQPNQARPHRNPWRHPWFLEGFTWLYLIWSLARSRWRSCSRSTTGNHRVSGRASPCAGTTRTR